MAKTQYTKENKRRNDPPSPPGYVSRVVGVLLVMLVSFPLLALVSYSPCDVPWLKTQGDAVQGNYVGITGTVGSFFGYLVFGLPVWLFPFWMLFFGILLTLGLLRRPVRRLGWLLLFHICLGALAEGHFEEAARSLDLRSAGGALGWFLMTKLLKPVFGAVGGTQIVVLGLLASLFFGVGFANWKDWSLRLFAFVRQKRMAALDEETRRAREEDLARREREKAEKREARERERAERLEAKRLREEERGRKKEEERRREEETERQNARLRAEREAQRERAAAHDGGRDAAEDRQPEEARLPQPEDDAPREDASIPYRLPPPSLLSPAPDSAADYGDTEKTAQVLAETLAEFRVPGIITHIEAGPVITTYEFQPAPRIRPEQVAAMDKTLEMRIKAKSLRIEAPIPGKGVCGIEVPNRVAGAVTVREIIDGETWKSKVRKLKLPLILGKDASGHDMVADLAEMPHLLVAGATGSGKSVCINAMLTGLLMSRTPDELKLILVDPKVVEFTGYNSIPHLVVPVITDPKKVALGLIWAIHEMDRRYKMLSAVGVKNIESFNNRARPAIQQDMFEDQIPEANRREAAYPDKLPYIVIVIDEMADLMLQVKKEIEDGITRLAAKSRAVGIHLVLATQRPTVNIVTGTIKANVPGRIAFQVAQKNDSKVILDRMGAESLIGKGDMLFLNPRTSKTTRAQGAFITDADAEAVTDFIRSQAKPKYIKEAQDQLSQIGEGAGASSPSGGNPQPGQNQDMGQDNPDGTDELFEAALAVIRRTKRASASSLQRALSIGYNRAARIFDQLEERGIVGPSRGALPREILIDLDGEIPTDPSIGDDASPGESQDAAEEEI